MGQPMKVVRVISFFILCYINLGLGEQKSWNFEFISIGANSTSEDLIKIDLSLERISRGVYGISGTIDVFADIEQGDNTMVEARIYRSATGSSEYKITPFTIQKQHIYDFFNTFYKDTLMKNLKDCSDLPQFENNFQPPLEKKTYTLESCQLSNDGMPKHMNDGFYKLDIIGSGKADWVLEAIVKVEEDS